MKIDGEVKITIDMEKDRDSRLVGAMLEALEEEVYETFLMGRGFEAGDVSISVAGRTVEVIASLVAR